MGIRLLQGLLFLPGLMIGLTLHEFAHAWSASLLGDDFARRRGRVSLNPLRHLSPLGTLAILVLPFGWGKPVPVNLYNFKRPKWDYLLSSLAGPTANVLVVGLCFLLMLWTRHSYRYGPLAEPFLLVGHYGLMMVALINVVLATVNLLPIPPLDGSKIWPCLIPGLKPSFGRRTVWLFIILLIVLIQTGSLGTIVGSVIKEVLDWMPASDSQLLDDLQTRGIKAHGNGEYAEAERHFTAALAIHPGSHGCLSRRAVAREKLGDLNGALADISRAVELRGFDPEYRERRARLYEALDREDEAMGEYEQAELLRAGPRDFAALKAARKANRDVLDKLNVSLVKVEFSGIPLSETLQFVRDVAELDVEVDWEALELVNVSGETPVTADLKDVTVREALRAFLGSAREGEPIRYGVADGKVIIPGPRSGPPEAE